MTLLRSVTGLRPLRAVLGALAVLAAQSAASAADRNAHDEAVSALGDLQAAVGEITASADLTVSGASPYKKAAQRAINAIVGRNASDYTADAGNPGDQAGALGHLTWLLQQPGTQRWDAAIRGSWVNATVAKNRLDAALHADELSDFQDSASSALEALLVALGHETGLGGLGGLRGALTTTALGVPEDAKTVSGCALPTEAPAYGVVKGYLTYIAIPNGDGPAKLSQPIGVRDVSIHDGVVVLHTAATDLIGALCPGQDSPVTATDPGGAAADPAAKLYTEDQARAGKQVYMTQCANCHGDKLQGKSAPAIAGTAFLKKAQILKWSISDLRHLIVTTMPRSNPGSLSPQQYAQVMAYLLAVDCYPAGQSKLPTDATPELKNTDLKQPAGAKPDNPDLGTCTPQQGND